MADDASRLDASEQAGDGGDEAPRARGLVVIAGAAIVVVLLVVAATVALTRDSSNGANGGSRSAGSPERPEPTEPTESTEPPEDSPAWDVEVVSCGAAPVVRVENPDPGPVSYTILVELVDGDETGRAAGQIERLEGGDSTELTLQALGKEREGDTCTVKQVVRTPL